MKSVVITREKLLAVGITIFLFVRVLIDGIYSGEKPQPLVLAYTAVSLGLTLALVFRMPSRRAKAVVGLFCFLGGSLSISALYSNVPFSDYLNFSLKLFVPCIFLVAAAGCGDLTYRAANVFCRYLFLPSIIVTAGAAIAI